MSSVVSFGTNTNAQRKRVMYFGTSVIYEGMPVCYDNSTTNILGIDTGASNAVSTTTTEGGQNEGKFLRVENPSADNLNLFAGVVAHGPKVGTTGVATGVWLDIFIPNGAIVPVRAGVACTLQRTILSIISATQYLGHALSATQARPVAIAEETYDRSTAGLVLAKLDPNLFIYQDSTGDAMYCGTGATAAAADVVVNRINVSSAQTAGKFGALEIYATASAGGCSLSGGCEYGMGLYVEASLTGAASAHTCGTGLWMNITGGAQPAGQVFSALEVGLYTSDDTDLTGIGIITPLYVQTQVNAASNPPPANTHYMMYFVNNGSDDPDGLFNAKTTGTIGFTGTGGANACTQVIPIRVSGSTYYIMCKSANA